MFKKIIMLNFILLFFLHAETFEYKELYRAMAKAEKQAYKETDVFQAISVFHRYMEPYVQNVKQSKRIKKLHRYGFVYSQLFEDCKNVNVETKIALEKSIALSSRRFSREISEYERNERELVIERERTRELQRIIDERNDEINIQEQNHTEQKQRELELLCDELSLAHSRIRSLVNRQQQLTDVMGELGEQIQKLRKINDSLVKIDYWWKKEKKKLAKQRFLVAEYVLNNDYGIFEYYLEHTGKKVTRIYYY
ncbi:hypothetical protein [Candidatus Uabimicrobium amorphum]|uniref:Uncharacterized protein n=1 Tax=Uabimicrobium amorphum TaxID=2596890 RepID=A0A5S9IPQ5_UABAM|nr:hypothetical protein [Candidatus Uabimicrobium amorphum]BBM85823.1 hypothetical protein UABAM_04201 [Candidatus Uabimicrobium amorphum]